MQAFSWFSLAGRSRAIRYSLTDREYGNGVELNVDGGQVVGERGEKGPQAAARDTFKRN
jgi:hypothetical protein